MLTYRQDFILRAPDLFPIHALSISNIWSQFLSYSYKRCLGWHVFVCLRCIVGYHLGSLHFSVCDFQKYMRDLSIKQCLILNWDTADISSGTSITQRKTLSNHDLLFSGSLQPLKLWWKRKWGCQESGSSLLIPSPHIRLASVYIKEPEIISFSVPISAGNVK